MQAGYMASLSAKQQPPQLRRLLIRQVEEVEAVKKGVGGKSKQSEVRNNLSRFCQQVLEQCWFTHVWVIVENICVHELWMHVGSALPAAQILEPGRRSSRIKSALLIC